MESVLPIGTVCILKDATKKIMITGYLMKSEETKQKVFDYIGCVFPEGVVTTEKNFLFNHEDIQEIFHKGFINEETEKLINRVNVVRENLKKETEKKLEELDVL